MLLPSFAKVVVVRCFVSLLINFTCYALKCKCTQMTGVSQQCKLQALLLPQVVPGMPEAAWQHIALAHCISHRRHCVAFRPVSDHLDLRGEVLQDFIVKVGRFVSEVHACELDKIGNSSLRFTAIILLCCRSGMTFWMILVEICSPMQVASLTGCQLLTKGDADATAIQVWLSKNWDKRQSLMNGKEAFLAFFGFLSHFQI